MPRPPRFFITPGQINGPSITITGDDLRHIATVLRMKQGDTLLLCDGAGTDYTVTIAGLDRSEIRTEITGVTRHEMQGPRIKLIQSIPKSDKMDLIVQKATELGVSGILPVITERTIVKLRDEEKRVARWRKIAREAAMQSNRSDIPFVMQVDRLDNALSALSSGPRDLLLLPWEEAADPIRNILRHHARPDDVFVLIGPEGGFSGQEADLARQLGFHAVSLGRNILRTETAALAALSMISYELISP